MPSPNDIIKEFSSPKVWEFNPQKKTFLCLLCSITYVQGRKMLMVQHVNSKKHKKNLQLNVLRQQMLMVQHVNSKKHKKNLELNVLRQQMLNVASFPLLPSRFKEDLCKAFVTSNIPLHKVEHPTMTSFLEKYAKDTIPSRHTLSHIMEMENKAMLTAIKDKLMGKSLFVTGWNDWLHKEVHVCHSSRSPGQQLPQEAISDRSGWCCPSKQPNGPSVRCVSPVQVPWGAAWLLRSLTLSHRCSCLLLQGQERTEEPVPEPAAHDVCMPQNQQGHGNGPLHLPKCGQAHLGGEEDLHQVHKEMHWVCSSLQISPSSWASPDLVGNLICCCVLLCQALQGHQGAHPGYKDQELGHRDS